MSTGNEVAMQQCLMGVQACQKAQANFEQRLQAIEARFSIPPPVPPSTATPLGPTLPAQRPTVPEGPVIRHHGVQGTALPIPRPAQPPPSLPQALAGALGSQLAPWAGLISTVIEATVRDLAPTLSAVMAAGQAPAGAVVPTTGVAAPPAPAAAPQPGAAEMTAPGPVEANELAWMAAEGLATGLPVEAVRTTALPPNYQHPPGVAPVPPGGLKVPMPPIG